MIAICYRYNHSKDILNHATVCIFNYADYKKNRPFISVWSKSKVHSFSESHKAKTMDTVPLKN